MISRGLTLLELLAATLILAASASIGVSVIGSAREATSHSQLTRRAIDVVSLFEQVRLESDSDEPIELWEHIDSKNIAWRVRVERLSLAKESTLDPRLPRLEWETLSIDAAAKRNGFERVLTLRRLVEAPSDALAVPAS